MEDVKTETLVFNKKTPSSKHLNALTQSRSLGPEPWTEAQMKLDGNQPKSFFQLAKGKSVLPEEELEKEVTENLVNPCYIFDENFQEEYNIKNNFEVFLTQLQKLL